MKELKVLLPEELDQELREFPAVRWSVVVRKLLKRELENLLQLKEVASKSKFKTKDVEELSKKVNKAIFEKLYSPKK